MINAKNQILNSKQIPNIKYQTGAESLLSAPVWILLLEVCLEFGI